MSKRVVVVGGGPAGMMAAITAAESGVQVTLLEPNERLGKKLNITGKGRCNITNDTDLPGLLANIPRNGKFLYSAFTRWGSGDTMAFFERLGVPLKVERGNRVFPVSDRAFDISAALERRLKTLHVRWAHDRAVDIETADGAVCAVRGEGESYPADAVILATGGVSYPATGSTGDGYAMAVELGHTVVDIKPSLVPLEAEGDLCPRMQGLALKNVVLRVKNRKNKVQFQEQGELLFTHFGLSGPLVLSASAHLRDFGKDAYRAVIDLKPALDEEKLDARLVRELSENANKDMQNVAGALVPRLMIPVVLELSGIPPERKAHDVTKGERRRLLETLKGLTIPVKGPRPIAEAIVTSGGIKVGEVDPRTMGSKKVPGLFFAGEILDVDAYTGGFNLQIAWCTGRAAGEGAAAYLRED